MITQQIGTDIVTSMKAKDPLRTEVLRSMKAAFTNELVAKGKKPTDQLEDADAQAVIKRLAKQRKEAAEQFTNGGRPELAGKELAELKVIEEYLPQMASREEIEAAVDAKIAELNPDPSKQGILIGAVMKELGGNADGSLIKEIIAERMSK